jgi:hypothetical protein
MKLGLVLYVIHYQHISASSFGVQQWVCQAAARVPYAACLASIAGLVLLYWAPNVKEPG